jgi:hypothetical protein
METAAAGGRATPEHGNATGFNRWLFTLLLKAYYRNDTKAKMAESRLPAISSHRPCMPKMVDVKQKMAFFFLPV